MTNNTIYAFARGNLGNQMFVYAAVRAAQLRYFRGEANIVIGYEKYNLERLKDVLKEFRLSPKVEFVARPHLPIKIRFVRRLYGLRLRFCKTPRELYESALRVNRCLPPPLRRCVIRGEDGYFPMPEHVSNQLLMDAFFQSERFFEEPYMKEVLKQDFSLVSPLPERCKEIIQLMRSSNSVCVCVRLGDYVRNPVHQICSVEYYKTAIRLMRERVGDCLLFLSSNDIPLAKDMLGPEFNVIPEPEGLTAAQTIALMSHCKHFIISNSSFNWWTQYLSESPQKIVMAPSRWYNTDIPCDIYQPDWVLIDV